MRREAESKAVDAKPANVGDTRGGEREEAMERLVKAAKATNLVLKKKPNTAARRAKNYEGILPRKILAINIVRRGTGKRKRGFGPCKCRAEKAAPKGSSARGEQSLSMRLKGRNEKVQRSACKAIEQR